MSLTLTKKNGICTLVGDEIAMGLVLREAMSGLNGMATAVGAGPDLRAFYSHYASEVEALRSIVSFRLLASNEQARILNENRAKALRVDAPALPMVSTDCKICDGSGLIEGLDYIGGSPTFETCPSCGKRAAAPAITDEFDDLL